MSVISGAGETTGGCLAAWYSYCMDGREQLVAHSKSWWLDQMVPWFHSPQTPQHPAPEVVTGGPLLLYHREPPIFDSWHPWSLTVLGKLLPHPLPFCQAAAPQPLHPFPLLPQWTCIGFEFSAIVGFPNVTGYVDMTNVPILTPYSLPTLYRNHHSYHSLNVQSPMVCKTSLTSILAKFPSSVYDSQLLYASRLQHLLVSWLKERAGSYINCKWISTGGWDHYSNMQTCLNIAVSPIRE